MITLFLEFEILDFVFKARRAFAIGSTIKIIPGPPPYGRSSTFLCLPVAHFLKSWILMLINFLARARLIIDSLKYESKISGKMVMRWKFFI